MKGELKSLTIENLIIPNDNNHSLKQSKKPSNNNISSYKFFFNKKC